MARKPKKETAELPQGIPMENSMAVPFAQLGPMGETAPALPEIGTGAEAQGAAGGAPAGTEGKAAGTPAEQPIGLKQIHEAQEKLHRYMAAKASIDQRIVDDEDWWRLRHWGHIRTKFGDKRQEMENPKSAWLLNSIMNKHADAMDNYPTATVLPRAQDDIEDARQLTEIMPVILEANDFEEVYDHSWWTKLKTGTRVIGVFWDSKKENGAGDISIREVDVLNLFWEPSVKDIQRSDAVFCLSRMTLKKLQEEWPDRTAELTGGDGVRPLEYNHDDQRDNGDEVTVVDWYYKRRSPEGKTLLHYCKFVGDTILFASENTDGTGGSGEMAAKGWYDDGNYPFVFDALFPIADSLCGFGEVDIMRDPQTYIDQMDAIILRNARMAGKKRWFMGSNGGINEDEYTDWDNDLVHVEGSLDENSLREITVSGLDASVYQVRQNKIDELKETSGNRDFSQGGTSGGVSAASAIAALQEAGSKLSRDMIKASYRAYTKMCEMVIERIRQFYDAPRTFRIIGENGEQSFATYSNAGIAPQQVDLGYGMVETRRPVFDMRVKAQRQDPFSTVSQNQLAQTLYQAGAFNVQVADQTILMLDMMTFEGKDELKRKIQERGTIFEQMQQQIQALMQQVMVLGGGKVTPAGADQAQAGGAMPQQAEQAGARGRDPLTDSFQTYASTGAQTAANKARKAAMPD